MKKPIRKIVKKYSINEIPVIEVLAEHLEGKALPLVILYHGWRNLKELMLTQARRLADIGIRVVIPDAMHHGERSLGDVSEIPSLTFWSSIHFTIAEFDTIINFYHDQDLILDGKIGIGGYSMGSITSFMLLTRRPNIKVAASIMGSPMPVRYHNRVKWHATERDYYFPKDLDQLLAWLPFYDLSRHPENIDYRPIFIWHGTEDERVPYAHSHDFYQAIKDKPFAKHVEFLTGDGEGHFVTTKLMDQITEFFRNNLL